MKNGKWGEPSLDVVSTLYFEHTHKSISEERKAQRERNTMQSTVYSLKDSVYALKDEKEALRGRVRALEGSLEAARGQVEECEGRLALMEARGVIDDVIDRVMWCVEVSGRVVRCSVVKCSWFP